MPKKKVKKPIMGIKKYVHVCLCFLGVAPITFCVLNNYLECEHFS